MSFSGQIYAFLGNFLLVQWLGVPTFTAKGLSSNSGWVTKTPQATCIAKGKKSNISLDNRIALIFETFFSIDFTSVSMATTS